MSNAFTDLLKRFTEAQLLQGDESKQRIEFTNLVAELEKTYTENENQDEEQLKTSLHETMKKFPFKEKLGFLSGGEKYFVPRDRLKKLSPEELLTQFKVLKEKISILETKVDKNDKERAFINTLRTAKLALGLGVPVQEKTLSEATTPSDNSSQSGQPSLPSDSQALTIPTALETGIDSSSSSSATTSNSTNFIPSSSSSIQDAPASQSVPVAIIPSGHETHLEYPTPSASPTEKSNNKKEKKSNRKTLGSLFGSILSASSSSHDQEGKTSSTKPTTQTAIHITKQSLTQHVNFKDLIKATKKGNIQGVINVIRLLKNQKEEINKLDEKKLGALHYAVLHKTKSKQLVETMLDSSITVIININLQNGMGETALHLAVKHQNKEVVELLLKETALSAVDTYEQDTKLLSTKDKNAMIYPGKSTPLMYALYKDNLDDITLKIIDILFTKAPQINVANQNGDTIATLALGHKDVDKLSDNVLSYINLHASTIKLPLIQKTALHIATSNPYMSLKTYEKVVNKFKSFSKSFEEFDDKKHTALINAIYQKVTYQVPAGYTGDRAQEAGYQLISAKVNCLLENGANTNTYEILSPLHLAIKGKDIELAINLINKYQANIGAFDYQFHSVLYHAAAEGSITLINELLIKDDKYIIKTHDNEFALKIALLNGHLEVAALLIEKGVAANIHINPQLSESAKFSSNSSNDGVDLSQIIQPGDSPLHIALRHMAKCNSSSAEYAHALKLALNSMSSLNAKKEYSIKNHQGVTPLVLAAELGLTDLIERKDKFVDRLFLFEEGQQALKAALLNNHIDTAIVLLERDVNSFLSIYPSYRLSVQNSNPSAIGQEEEIVKKDGWDKTQLIQQGDTPLHIAFKLLNRAISAKDNTNINTYNKLFRLCIPQSNKNTKTQSHEINIWLVLNAQKVSPILLAVQLGPDYLTNELPNNIFATVEGKKEGQKALKAALLKGDINMAIKLINKGADPDFHLTVVKDEDKTGCISQNDTPLIFAVKIGHQGLFEAILNSEVISKNSSKLATVVNAINVQKRTALLTAIKFREIAMAQKLVKMGARDVYSESTFFGGENNPHSLLRQGFSIGLNDERLMTFLTDENFEFTLEEEQTYIENINKKMAVDSLKKAYYDAIEKLRFDYSNSSLLSTQSVSEQKLEDANNFDADSFDRKQEEVEIEQKEEDEQEDYDEEEEQYEDDEEEVEEEDEKEVEVEQEEEDEDEQQQLELGEKAAGLGLSRITPPAPAPAPVSNEISDSSTQPSTSKEDNKQEPIIPSDDVKKEKGQEQTQATGQEKGKEDNATTNQGVSTHFAPPSTASTKQPTPYPTPTGSITAPIPNPTPVVPTELSSQEDKQKDNGAGPNNDSSNTSEAAANTGHSRSNSGGSSTSITTNNSNNRPRSNSLSK